MANPVNTVHFAGGNVSLQCSASGIPTPTITWFKNGAEMLASGDRLTVNSIQTPDTAVSTLVIQGLLISDDADYQCEANSSGPGVTVFTATSLSAHLTVQREP